jgi:hypothetical protein
MAETATIDRQSAAKPSSRPRSRKPATVSASALARHLDCSRTYIGKLEAEGVIQRQGDGFPLDRAALSCGTCDVSASNRPAVWPTPRTSRSRPRCCNCG